MLIAVAAHGMAETAASRYERSLSTLYIMPVRWLPNPYRLGAKVGSRDGSSKGILLHPGYRLVVHCLRLGTCHTHRATRAAENLNPSAGIGMLSMEYRRCLGRRLLQSPPLPLPPHPPGGLLCQSIPQTCQLPGAQKHL